MSISSVTTVLKPQTALQLWVSISGISAAIVDSSPIAPRTYVLLISGTMNPPHVGHVRLGLAAAARLQADGHTVSAICFVPVHDNYLCNKVMLKQLSGDAVRAADLIAFPMHERCALLRDLISRESGDLTQLCHVIDYEHSCGDASLLAPSHVPCDEQVGLQATEQSGLAYPVSHVQLLLWRMRRDFPRVKWVSLRDRTARRFVVSQPPLRIVTTAGVTAGIDGALHFVAAWQGKGVAEAVREFVEWPLPLEALER